MNKKIKEFPLRLEWVEAGSLAENPNNWRKHPPAQMSALKQMIGDAEIGWAGALLYNERTNRLIDGHARRNIAAKTLVPVLIGDWSEEAERKILLTLDPLAELATADQNMLENLIADSSLDQDLLDILGGQDQTPFEFNDPPESVKDNITNLASLKSQRKEANNGTAEKNDTEKYLIIVYASREQKNKTLEMLGLPEDERYVSAAAIVLKARRLIKPLLSANGKEIKSAPKEKSGAGG